MAETGGRSVLASIGRLFKSSPKRQSTENVVSATAMLRDPDSKSGARALLLAPKPCPMFIVVTTEGMEIFDYKTKRLMKHIDTVVHSAFVHDTLLIGSSEKSDIVRAWSLDRLGKRPHKFVGHKGWVTNFVVSHPFLYTSGSDNTAKKWPLPSSGTMGTTIKPVLEFSGHKDFVTSLVVGDDNALYTGSCDETCAAWDITTGDHKTSFVGHENWVYFVRYHREALYSCSIDETVRIWQPKSGRCVRVLNVGAPVTFFTFFNDVLYAADNFFRVTSWNVKGVQSGRRQAVFDGHSGKVKAIVFHNNLVYTCASDASLRCWNLKGRCMGIYRGHSQDVNALCVCPYDDLKHPCLLSASLDGSVRQWSPMRITESGADGRPRQCTGPTLLSATMSPEERTLFCITKCQAVARGFLVRRQMRDIRPVLRTSKCKYDAFMELYKMEQRYVTRLGELLQCYIKPLRMDGKSKKPINASEHAIIFGNIEDVFNHHCRLASQLASLKMKSKWPFIESLGELCSKDLESLIPLYEAYIRNFRQSIKTFTYCVLRDTDLRDYVQQTALQGMHGRVEGLLALPTAHLSAYVRALGTFARNIQPGSADFGAIIKSFALMYSMDQSLQKYLKHAESSESLQFYSKLIETKRARNFVVHVPGRRLLRQGELIVSQRKWYCFLFSDSLLLTKCTMGSYCADSVVWLCDSMLKSLHKESFVLSYSPDKVSTVNHEIRAVDSADPLMAWYSDLSIAVHYSVNGVIGRDVEVLRRRDGRPIPLVVSALTSFIQAHASEAPGCWEEESSSYGFSRLQTKLSTDPAINLERENVVPRDATSLLLHFFYELPTPIVPTELHQTFLHCRDAELADVLKGTSVASRSILNFTCHWLYEMAEDDRIPWTIPYLAAVFGVAFFQTSNQEVCQVKELWPLIRRLSTLLSLTPTLFPERVHQSETLVSDALAEKRAVPLPKPPRASRRRPSRDQLLNQLPALPMSPAPNRRARGPAGMGRSGSPSQAESDVSPRRPPTRMRSESTARLLRVLSAAGAADTSETRDNDRGNAPAPPVPPQVPSVSPVLRKLELAKAARLPPASPLPTQPMSSRRPKSPHAPVPPVPQPMSPHGPVPPVPLVPQPLSPKGPASAAATVPPSAASLPPPPMPRKTAPGARRKQLPKRVATETGPSASPRTILSPRVDWKPLPSPSPVPTPPAPSPTPPRRARTRAARDTPVGAVAPDAHGLSMSLPSHEAAAAAARATGAEGLVPIRSSSLDSMARAADRSRDRATIGTSGGDSGDSSGSSSVCDSGSESVEEIPSGSIRRRGGGSGILPRPRKHAHVRRSKTLRPPQTPLPVPGATVFAEVSGPLPSPQVAHRRVGGRGGIRTSSVPCKFGRPRARKQAPVSMKKHVSKADGRPAGRGRGRPRQASTPMQSPPPPPASHASPPSPTSPNTDLPMRGRGSARGRRPVVLKGPRKGVKAVPPPKALPKSSHPSANNAQCASPRAATPPLLKRRLRRELPVPGLPSSADAKPTNADTDG